MKIVHNPAIDLLSMYNIYQQPNDINYYSQQVLAILIISSMKSIRKHFKNIEGKKHFSPVSGIVFQTAKVGYIWLHKNCILQVLQIKKVTPYLHERVDGVILYILDRWAVLRYCSGSQTERFNSSSHPRRRTNILSSMCSF